MYSSKKMLEKLNSNNFNFKKKFGQNFIIDENIIDNIIKKANILPNSLVIEIGPGSGSLTKKLSKVAKNVLGYEIDINLKPILDDLENNVKIIYQDFLKSNIINDIKNYDYDNLYVIANLPYYITTPIVMKIIEDKLPVNKIIIMVQKEVGQRFKAKVNTKDYNSLSVYLQYYFDIKKIMDVSKNVFIPKPNVDSIVIELTKKELLPLKNEELLFKLVKDSFKQKRKTLKNNLKDYDLEIISSVLKEEGLNLNIRAEQLSLEQFIKIANRLD